ncbi:PAS domain S-box protein [Mucilaginibacter sp. FT3.2]|uniref:PAS domain S-box protein n=1 Tax=Mucilaginibacter sp. FT3.2 TaxID=2723090 RepID=UPI00161077C3|nr:PAS domain S-box protein [Mucilaginibacter sp. FT3.2]MBB6235316.1 PAS domain S-box-containing protein [Mucilaginibacter sp. FT3.2]
MTQATNNDINGITEEKTEEQQREFDKNNLNALINSTDDLIWSVDRKLNLITCNEPFKRALETISGHAIVKGESVLPNEIQPDLAVAYTKFYERALTGVSFKEIRHNNDNYAEVSFYPIQLGTEIIGVACRSRDITKIKQTQDRLINSERRYRQIVETSQEGIWVLDEHNKTIFVNKRMCEILEYTEEEMIGRTNFSFKDETGQQIAREQLERRKNGISETEETKFITKSGKPIWAQLSASPIFNEAGGYIGALAMISEITGRRKIEQELAQSESRLKEAQSLAKIGNFECDMDQRSEIWSDEIYKIYGLNKEEVTPSKQLFLSFVHPDDLSDVKMAMTQCLTTFQNSIFDFRFKRKDGALRYGYSEVRLQFDKKRRPIRIFGILQDVTERKMAEMERTKMINDLMLRNTELEQFAYIISHNLRAPLVNIIGASNVLTDPGLSVGDKEFLYAAINLSGVKLDDIIKDLNLILEIKREINTTKELVRFSDLVDNIKTHIKDLMQSYDIEIRCDFSEINELLTLKIYLHSVFYNLISNSIKYRKPNVQTIIEIKSRNINNKVELVFIDNGMGIDLQKNGDKVFGLYNRFHNHIAGKGMGLFMVKSHVEALGGKIAIESTEGQGIQFKIEFNINA